MISRARPIELGRARGALRQCHADAALIRSLPGIGVVPGAERLGDAGDLSRIRSGDALASATRMAPVPRQSGKSRVLRRPSGGDKDFERILSQPTLHSLGHHHSRIRQGRKPRGAKRPHRSVIAPARRAMNVLWPVAHFRTP